MNQLMRASSNSCGKGSFIALSVFTASMISFPAQASFLWNWSYTGAGIAASGTLTTNDTPDSGGYYEINGITGSRDGVAIISLVPAGEAIPGNAGFPVDNLIASNGLLTHSGFGFKTADGNYANPFYANFRTPPGFLEVFAQPASMGLSEAPIEFAAAIVPEPSASALLLTALAGLASVPRYGLRESPAPRRPRPREHACASNAENSG